MNDAAQVVDLGIPTLPAVLDPVQLAKHLEFFSRPPWEWGRVREIGVNVLKSHSGSRCTVDIALLTSGGVHSVVGKVYASDGFGVYQAMKRISEAGFGPDAEFSIPQPLAFLPDLHLLLQEKVRGRTAEELFLTDDPRCRVLTAERCARWLARFQALAPKTGPVFDMNEYLASLERWSRRIAELGEPLAGKANRLFERLERAASDLAPIETCAGHGSYCHTQIILANDRIVTFDWDGYDVADPSRDVARFIVALERLALGRFGSTRALDSAAEAFRKTYIACGRPEVESHLPFFEAAVCIKLAKYELSRRPLHWRQMVIGGMLDEGLHKLEQ